jgi:gluconolactonase
MAFDPATGAVEPYLTRHLLEPFHGCNDLTVASNGDLYFTDQGMSGLHAPYGRVYRLTVAGRLELVLDNIPSPNGLVLNKAENALMLAVTRDNAIWRVPLTADGGVTKVGAFIRMSGGNGPDGVAMDEDDNIAVCHVGMGCAWLFDRIGEPILRIRAPEGLKVTNCAYGGADGKSLFITESGTGTILRADMPVAGRKLHLRAA